MNNLVWKEDLNRLLARLSAAGTGPDISDMDLTQLWAVYCVLRRMLGETKRGGNE